MNKYWMVVSMTFLALGLVPHMAAAQCRTPEGCMNIPGECQACVDEAHSQSGMWEDCYIYDCFCQLEGECYPTEEETLAATELPADLGVTVAGTFAMSRAKAEEGRAEALRSCRGYVVASVDRVEDRPRLITLE